jgi:hypothetical protein
MSFALILMLALVTFVTALVGSGTNEIALVATIMFFPSAIALYFSPAVVAGVRRHTNALPIFVLNFLLGWTIIGWVGALIWAYASLSGFDAAPRSSEAGNDVRACPLCAEPIRSAAVKCRYCGSPLEAAVERTTIKPEVGDEGASFPLPISPFG